MARSWFSASLLAWCSPRGASSNWVSSSLPAGAYPSLQRLNQRKLIPGLNNDSFRRSTRRLAPAQICDLLKVLELRQRWIINIIVDDVDDDDDDYVSILFLEPLSMLLPIVSFPGYHHDTVRCLHSLRRYLEDVSRDKRTSCDQTLHFLQHAWRRRSTASLIWTGLTSRICDDTKWRKRKIIKLKISLNWKYH